MSEQRMETAFIIGIVGLVLIFVVMIMMLFDPTLAKGVAQGLGSLCTQTADCRSGLVCIQGVDPNYDNPQCLIPQGGSCFWQPNYCMAGLTCHNGACVEPLQSMMSEEAAPLAPPARLMTPATQAQAPQVSVDEEMAIDPTLPPTSTPTPSSSPADPRAPPRRWPTTLTKWPTVEPC